MMAVLFILIFALALLSLAVLLKVLRTVTSRLGRFGFLLFLPLGAVLAFVLATVPPEVAGTEDWTLLLTLVPGEGLVALMSIRLALTEGGKWKSGTSV